MDTLFLHYISSSAAPALFLIIAVLIYFLSKGADLLVDEALALSVRLRIPKVLVGLTIVSVGTTIPEAAVSVIAAVDGRPEIALGNAVGSVICGTGLILGLITLFAPISLSSSLVKRQGWFQLFVGVLLVLSCIPFFTAGNFLKTGGILSQRMGMVFLGLLGVYLLGSLHWLRKKDPVNAQENIVTENSHIITTLGKIILGSGFVVIASHFLIPTVEEAALRLHISEGAVSATLVAFGTSLPELVTSITAVRKGHGELALGNIIGANILNVLFVAGAAASVTSQGLAAPVHFFTVLFPAMIATLVIFGMGVHLSGSVFKKPFSVMLLTIYAVVTLSSYLVAA
ncbi:MAG: sodium:calcium antiporter [Pseudomonadota bacterium]